MKAKAKSIALLFAIFIFVIPSANLNANNIYKISNALEQGDPVFSQSDFILAVMMTRSIVISVMQGKPKNKKLENLRNVKIAEAIIKVHRVHPNDPNTSIIFYEMLNLYIKKANEFALEKNKQFFIPELPGHYPEY